MMIMIKVLKTYNAPLLDCILKAKLMLNCSLSALSTIGFGDMVPRKGREPSSGIQTLELVIRGLYIVFGLALVSSLLSAVVSATEVFNRWNLCRRAKCVYQGLIC